MLDLLTRLGAATIPILSSITTVAVLTLLRLLAPTVRWRRRLKQDTDVLGPLPQGGERELWAASVEAQAIRLRLYFAANTRVERAVEWIVFAVLLNVALLSLLNVTTDGRSIAVRLTGAEWPVFVLSLIGCVFVVVQLVRGFPIVPRSSVAAKEYLAVRRSFGAHTERVYAARRQAAEVEAAKASAEPAVPGPGPRAPGP